MLIEIVLSLMRVKYIFFWFYISVGFEGNIKCAKKSITSGVIHLKTIKAWLFPYCTQKLGDGLSSKALTT